MADLSPAAQAVLDASNLYPCYYSRQIIAATLRAAADQAVPINSCGPGSAKRLARHDVRYALLYIADELEGL